MYKSWHSCTSRKFAKCVYAKSNTQWWTEQKKTRNILKFEQQIVLLPPPPPFEIQEFFLEHVQLGTVLACGLAFSTPPPFDNIYCYRQKCAFIWINIEFASELANESEIGQWLKNNRHHRQKACYYIIIAGNTTLRSPRAEFLCAIYGALPLYQL